MVRAGVQTRRRVGQAIVPGTGADGDGPRTAVRAVSARPAKRRPAGIFDGNRDGNDADRQRPKAAVDSRKLSHIESELGIRHF